MADLLYEAVFQGNRCQIVEILQNLPEKVNEKNSNDADYTPLHYACERGMKDIANLLIEKVHGLKAGNTPLLFACWNGNIDLVNLLFEKGADLNFQNFAGNSALMAACSGGHVAVATFLLERGVDPSLKNKDGNTALHLAKERNISDCVALLNHPPSSSLLLKILVNMRRDIENTHMEIKDALATETVLMKNELTNTKSEIQISLTALEETSHQAQLRIEEKIESKETNIINEINKTKDEILTSISTMEDLKKEFHDLKIQFRSEIEELKRELRAAHGSIARKDQEIESLRMEVVNQTKEIARLMAYEEMTRP